MLDCAVDPGLDGLGQRVIGPILVFLGIGMVDYAGNMPGSGHHEAGRAAIEAGCAVDRGVGGDVVIP